MQLINPRENRIYSKNTEKDSPPPVRFLNSLSVALESGRSVYITKYVEDNREQGKVWAERGCRVLEGGSGVCSGRPKCNFPVLTLSRRVHRHTDIHTLSLTHIDTPIHVNIYIDANTYTHTHMHVFILYLSICVYIQIMSSHSDICNTNPVPWGLAFFNLSLLLVFVYSSSSFLLWALQ